LKNWSNFLKKEIEVKLEIASESVEKLLKCSFFSTKTARVEQKMLNNTYFDTSDWQLNKRRIALRVRDSDGRFIQTLKTKGISEQGLHQRLEWEWDLQQPQLDLSLLPQQHWPVAIAVGDLKALFTTNFSRQLWYFQHIDANGVESSVEMALDRGLVTADGVDQQLPICELELELLEGSATALIEIAAILTAQCPELRACDVSKAARGYQLLEQSNQSHECD